MPFLNLSGDPEQQYFSDGITEDIITELSRFRTLFVIAAQLFIPVSRPAIETSPKWGETWECAISPKAVFAGLANV